MTEQPFVPPRDAQFYLLRAHRQPLSANLAAHFIEQFSQPGDLVVDPFVASDAIVRAAVERGRRILAAESNPLVAWAARVQATLPAAREINAALGRFGDTRKESETLRAFVEKLYTTRCAQCGAKVTADYFVWRHEGEKPRLSEKVYACAKCGTRRDAVDEGDRLRADQSAPRSLTRALLTQRLFADDAAHTPHLKRLLEFYTPRNLNALATLTQKLDSEFREPGANSHDAVRQVLLALLLHALDTGSSLYPAADAMPAREIPPEFIEVNIWRAMEYAARGLGERAPALRLASNAKQVLSAQSPAYIGHGGARFLAENAGGQNAALMLSSPARLDPMFWEMSFLWTRWLLGKNAAVPLEPLLDSERQRWTWYGGALVKAFEESIKFARADAHAVVAFPSGSHAMIEALMLAAAPAYALTSFVFHPERGAQHTTEFGALRGDYQAVWERRDANAPALALDDLAAAMHQGALRGALRVMRERAEPVAFSWVHHAALNELARTNVLASAMKAQYRQGDNAFQFLRHRMDEGLKEGYAHEIDHIQQKTRVLWVARDTDDSHASLSERVECAAAKILSARKRVAAEELRRLVMAEFPGLQTPESELVELCARAHADFFESEWVWREDDIDAQLAAAHTLTAQLGAHLGYQVIAPASPYEMLWRAEKIIPASAGGSVAEERFYEDAYVFIFRARADFHALMQLRVLPLRGLVVLPESQIELTRERLRRDPRWLKKLERIGWEFLRVPMLQFLKETDYATRPEFHLTWGLEPAIERGREQLELFE